MPCGRYPLAFLCRELRAVNGSGYLLSRRELPCFQFRIEQRSVQRDFKGSAAAWNQFYRLHFRAIRLLQGISQTGCPWLVVSGGAVFNSHFHAVYPPHLSVAVLILTQMFENCKFFVSGSSEAGFSRFPGLGSLFA